MDLLCLDAAPHFLGIFDFAVAPRLLFYAYVPAIAIALLLGTFVMVKDRFSLSSKLLFGIAASFALWSLNTFMQWVSAPAALVMYGWEITGLLEVAISFFTLYFVHVFLAGRDASFRVKAVMAAAMLPVFAFLPTHFNAPSFDIVACEGASGPLWIYVAVLELAAVAWILIACALRYRVEPDLARLGSIRNLAIGSTLFLGLFTLSNVLGELTLQYEINLVGPIGMVLFMGFLAYMIVRFKAFNAKLIATDALVWALCLLIASQFLFVEDPVNYLLVGVTLSMAMGFGLILSRSVRREVEQREKLQALSEQLQGAIGQLQQLSRFKSQLLSLASHQIKAPLAAMKGYISLMLEGGYGPIPDPLQKPMLAMQHSADGLVDLITSLLDLRKIEEGKMDYTFDRQDLAAIVRDVYDELRVLASEKGLSLTLEGADEPCYVLADRTKLKQVAQNLVDNSIKYTPSGSTAISLTRTDRLATVTVQDTGLGMSPALLPRLFDEFTRDQRVQRTIRGTGLGLYIAKRIIEAHGGTIAATSEGEGRGSTFSFSIPIEK